MYQIDMPITPDHPPPPSSNDAAGALREWQGLAMPQNLRVKDEVLNKALVLFSLYQYPQYLFIHLEAFLEDYRKDFHRGKYWSYPLLYAICALGARISTDPSVKEKADVLSHFAETIVIAQALGRPHITVVQTLLCLAFYELGSGNHSKGWSLAGKFCEVTSHERSDFR
jgi:hypothetical protein